MNTNRDCGCKSFRTCLQCEKSYGLEESQRDKSEVEAGKFPTVFEFDPKTNEIHEDGKEEERRPFKGIKIIENFVTEEEEARLVKDLDDIPWDASQSGRRKQNFGPKTNFKKRKAKLGAFEGFPATTKFVQDRFEEQVACLKGFRSVEQCSIEYEPSRGSCIEPHIDDCWIWGERIVQLNLLSDSILTMIPYDRSLDERQDRYNLPDVRRYPKILDDSGDKVLFNPVEGDVEKNEGHYDLRPFDGLLHACVKIPLPRRSLLVMHGEPRYDWKHCIFRRDIHDRRIVLAYRELTPFYLPGGEQYEEIGKDILAKAATFF